jgi:hypothetical protein
MGKESVIVKRLMFVKIELRHNTFKIAEFRVKYHYTLLEHRTGRFTIGGVEADRDQIEIRLSNRTKSYEISVD